MWRSLLSRRWCRRSLKVGIEKITRQVKDFCFSRELLFFTSKTVLKPREKSTRMEETRGKFVLHRCIWGGCSRFTLSFLENFGKLLHPHRFLKVIFYNKPWTSSKYRVRRVCVWAVQNRCMRAKTFTQVVGGDRTNLVSTVSMGQVDEQLRIRFLRSFF